MSPGRADGWGVNKTSSLQRLLQMSQYWSGLVTNLCFGIVKICHWLHNLCYYDNLYRVDKFYIGLRWPDRV